MRISTIRTYIVELQCDELQGKAGMADLFPGESIHKVDKTCDMPLIFRVETLLSIQGQSKPKGEAWVEQVEEDKVEGSMDFTGEAIEEKEPSEKDITTGAPSHALPQDSSSGEIKDKE